MRTRQIGKIYSKLAEYERMEVISLLEQAVWKLKIDEANSTNTHSIVEQAKIDESTSLDVRPDSPPAVDRHSCRINCGSDIVISNALQFLGDISDDCMHWGEEDSSNSSSSSEEDSEEDESSYSSSEEDGGDDENSV